MAPIEGFGSSNDSDGRFTREFKLKEGSNVFRIFPSMHSLVASGTWRLYAGRHFGYEGVSKKDASKTIPRPFKCIQEIDWQSRIIIADCPECTLIADKAASLEARIAELKNKNLGATKEILKGVLAGDEICQNLMGWLKAHNCSRRWFMNVMSAGGECGVLGISNKLKKQLDEEIKNLKAEGIDPRDLDNGIWFNFIRVGTGWEVPDTVKVLMEKMEVPGQGVMERKKKAPVSQAQAQAALQSCPDLSKYLTVLPYAQIKLLTETGSDPETVDKVFAMGQPVESGLPMPPSQVNLRTPVIPQTPPPAPPVAPKDDLPSWAGGEGKPTATTNSDKIAALRAQLEAAEKEATTVATPPPTVISSPIPTPLTPTPKPEGEPEPIDFLKRFRMNPDG